MPRSWSCKSTFSNNYASAIGGAVGIYNGSIINYACTFTSNVAGWGYGNQAAAYWNTTVGLWEATITSSSDKVRGSRIKQPPFFTGRS